MFRVRATRLRNATRRFLMRRPPDKNTPRFRSEFIDGPLAVASACGIAVSAYLIIDALTHPKTSSDQINAIKTSLTLVAFVGATLAAVYTYRRQRLAESDAHRVDAVQLASRYTQAAEQLGHDSAAVRLAGVYAMSRLADDWEEQRQTCVDVLCAYLRMPFDYETANDDPKYRQGEEQVRTTIQRVIADHLRPPVVETNLTARSWSAYRIDLQKAAMKDLDFRGIDVRQFINFAGATFVGDARFTAAKFSSRSDFGAAKFYGHANFGGTTFQDGVTFAGVTFSRSAHFGKARFNGYVNFGWTEFSDYAGFDHAQLLGTSDFGNVKFSGYVGFNGATFGDIASFRGAMFSGNAEYGDTTFSGNAGFTNANFGGRSAFYAATFARWTDFSGATFSGSAVFGRAEFRGHVSFSKATFSRTADFGEVTFSIASEFDGTRFEDPTYFGKSIFIGDADFSKTVFSAAHSFDQAKFSQKQPRGQL